MSAQDNVVGTSARPVKLQEVTQAPTHGAALFDPEKLDLIQGVKVRLVASVGRADISVADLFGLKEDSIVALDTASDEPIEVYLDAKLVGRGELVVVGDHFGVRFTELGPGSTS